MRASWSADLQAAPGWETWLAVTDTEQAAALAIKAAPMAGVVDLGCGVAPARRGQGVATAAVLALLPELALHAAKTAKAETAVANPSSGRVLEKAGFRRVGERVGDEDGCLILWQRELERAAA